jgi:hypothetical protein
MTRHNALVDPFSPSIVNLADLLSIATGELYTVEHGLSVRALSSNEHVIVF